MKRAILFVLVTIITGVAEASTQTLSSHQRLARDIYKELVEIDTTVSRSAPLVPVISTGATDSRFLRNGGIATYGHSGLAAEMGDGRAHGKDGRLLIKSFFDGLEYQYRPVKALSAR
jgi:acetylornithine deacetylase/succinyl-diaminopimelate desuccinylase-like protein